MTNANDLVILIHLLGFITGLVLYGMLLGLALRSPPMAHADLDGKSAYLPPNRLPLATAILGLMWNLGGLATFGLRDLGIGKPLPLLIAAAFSALSFLPAVLVHSAQHREQVSTQTKFARLLIFAAYGLSAFATVMHFISATRSNLELTHAALRILIAGFSAVSIGLFYLTRRQPGRQRAVWGVALSLFAVSALHLSDPRGDVASWSVELVGHHASLLLAVAILYQDYRFAFADLFLKRALALVILVAIASGMYLTAGKRLLSINDAHGDVDPRAVGGLLALWVATALLYPAVRRAVAWFVQSIVLRRPDYSLLRTEIAQRIASCEAPELVLDQICTRLKPALSAQQVRWLNVDAPANVNKRK